MRKKQELAGIVKCCEGRFNRGSANYWKHGDFTDLSREILLDKEVNISPNTLKRIFGKIAVEDDYLPQQATIEALKRYGGYVGSEIHPSTGINESAMPFEASQGAEDAKATTIEINTRSGLNKYRLPFIIFIVVITVSGMLFLFIRKPGGKLSGSIKQTGIEGLLPATAFFNLEVPNGSDSLFVDFGDKTPLLYVKPGQKSISHNYIFPGVFKVSLKTRHATYSAIPVSVRSDKWIGLAYPPQGTVPYRYYEAPAVIDQDSLFHVSNRQLHEMGIDTVGTFYTQLCNFTPIYYEGEDFVFEATFKNALPGKGISCKGTQFQISGLNGIVRFKLVNAGCSYRVINVTSEQTFDGRISNLSQFVIDLARWNTVKIVNQNKRVTFYVNGKPLFSGIYKNSLGKIQGLLVEFEGNGFVKNCSLKTIDDRLLYEF